MEKTITVPIDMFNKVNATPKKGKEVIYKNRVGRKIKTRIIRINRTSVILKLIE